MKKLTYAIALSSLLLAGCSQEEGIMESTGELVTLNYNVSLGNNVQSRADASQELAVNNLLCVVFEKETGNEVKREKVPVTNGSASYSPKLFSNINYRIVFWAYYEDNDDNSCFKFEDVKAIQINEKYDKGNFIENKFKDAYTAYHDVTLTKENQTPYITLTRPFGMVNIYTSKADYDAAVEMGSTPTSGTLTIGNCSKTFDAYNQQWLTTSDGNIVLNTSVSATPVTYNNIDDCINLASEYVFGYGTVATTQISVIDHSNKTIYQSSIENMPLGVNTRTNLYNEKLFTGGVTYTITISQGFSGDINESVN